LLVLQFRRQLGERDPVRGVDLLPVCARRRGAGPDAGLEVLVHLVRHQELGVLRPAVEALGPADLLRTERFAVRAVGAFLGGGAVGDPRVHDDQRGPVGLVLERAERPRQHPAVVRVPHPDHVPAERDELGRDVVGERQVGGPLDGDLVVVVDPAEVVQTQMPRQ